MFSFGNALLRNAALRYWGCATLLVVSAAAAAGPIRYDMQITNDYDSGAWDHTSVPLNVIAPQFPDPQGETTCGGSCHQKIELAAAASGKISSSQHDPVFVASRLQLHFYGDTKDVAPFPNPSSSNPAINSTGTAAGYYLARGRATFANVSPSSALSHVRRVAAGDEGACALQGGSAVLCWGADSYVPPANYILNDNATAVPTAVGGLPTDLRDLSVGYGHACALTVAGAVYCWGDNEWGQLGNGTTAFSATAVAVTGLPPGIIAISAGEGQQSCALTATGAAYCWGYNGDGELGNGTQTPFVNPVPVPVSGLSSGVQAIAAGADHTCALTAAGAVLCWGLNNLGQLGNPTATGTVTTPVSVALPPGRAVAVNTGGEHTCALMQNGTAWCWGYNQYGELGSPTTTSQFSSTPVQVVGLPGQVIAIAAGYDEQTCASVDNGSLWCWGSNGDGQLGNGYNGYEYNTSVPQYYTSVPIQVLGLPGRAVQLAAGGYHTCALVSGEVACWGYNRYGTLGRGGYPLTPGLVRAAPLAQRPLSGAIANSAGIFVSVDGTHHAIGIGSGWPNAIAPTYPGGALADDALCELTCPLTELVDSYDLTSAFSMSGFTVSNAAFPLSWPATNPALPLIGGGSIELDPTDPRSRGTTYFRATPLVPARVFQARGHSQGGGSEEPTGGAAIYINGTLTLGNGAQSFNPVTDDVVFGLGPYTAMLPAGSFSNPVPGKFEFSGNVNGSAFGAVLATTDSETYAFTVTAQNLDLTKTPGGVAVAFYIGNNAATGTLAPE